jgi:hypothetical protein
MANQTCCLAGSTCSVSCLPQPAWAYLSPDVATATVSTTAAQRWLPVPLLLLLLSLVGQTSTAVVVESPTSCLWSNVGRDAQHSGRSSCSGPKTNFMLQWSQNVATTCFLDGFVSEPFVGPSGTLFALSCGSSLDAFTPNGTLLWQYPLEGLSFTSVALVDSRNMVYFSTEMTIVAVNGDNGDMVWKYVLPTTPVSKAFGLTLSGESVLVSTGLGITAINVITGHTRWQVVWTQINIACLLLYPVSVDQDGVVVLTPDSLFSQALVATLKLETGVVIGASGVVEVSTLLW